MLEPIHKTTWGCTTFSCLFTSQRMCLRSAAQLSGYLCIARTLSGCFANCQRTCKNPYQTEFHLVTFSPLGLPYPGSRCEPSAAGFRSASVFLFGFLLLFLRIFLDYYSFSRSNSAKAFTSLENRSSTSLFLTACFVGNHIGCG